MKKYKKKTIYIITAGNIFKGILIAAFLVESTKVVLEEGRADPSGRMCTVPLARTSFRLRDLDRLPESHCPPKQDGIYTGYSNEALCSTSAEVSVCMVTKALHL